MLAMMSWQSCWMMKDAEEAKSLGLVTEVITGSKNALHQMAFAALADEKTSFNRVKYAAKVRQIESKASDFTGKLQAASKLPEIETALRARGLSRAEATAIVAAVKRVHGDHVALTASDETEKALDLIKNFKF